MADWHDFRNSLIYSKQVRHIVVEESPFHISIFLAYTE